MCGIVGYVGREQAAPILLDGLRRLEYRGYDSAGVAIVNGDQLETRKCAGRIASLAKLISQKPAAGSYGISHTRWATHGKVTDENAHPHFDATGKIALVHNGVIENYQALKEQLIQDGDTNFRSDTDTEVLAHLIGKIYQKLDGKDSKARLVNATRAALKQVIGTYGIAVVHAEIPDFIVGARRGSPLVLGVGKEENFLASDVSAIVAHTRDVVYLNDFDLVSFDRENFDISSIDGAVGQQSRIHRRRHQEGRLPALHAQGNLRAVRHGARRDARSNCSRRFSRKTRRIGYESGGIARRLAHCSHWLRHRAPRRSSWRIHD